MSLISRIMKKISEFILLLRGGNDQYMKDKLYNPSILNNLYDGLYITDKNKKILFWNESAERITGYSYSEVIGKPYCSNILMHIDGEGNSLCTKECPIDATLKDYQIREIEAYIHHKEGHRIPVSIRVVPLLDEDGENAGAIEIFVDNSVHHELTKEIHQLSMLTMVDTLTGLKNRRFAEDYLIPKLHEVHRNGAILGILFFDIDHFKHVNDQYGHDIGDDVLKMVSKTLVNGIRISDTVVRWGGEEIIVILSGNLTEKSLECSANNLRILVGKSCLHVNEELLCVTVSGGGTLAKSDDTIDSLIKRVDQLMYHSKVNGRNLITIG